MVVDGAAVGLNAVVLEGCLVPMNGVTLEDTILKAINMPDADASLIAIVVGNVPDHVRFEINDITIH